MPRRAAATQRREMSLPKTRISWPLAAVDSRAEAALDRGPRLGGELDAAVLGEEVPEQPELGRIEANFVGGADHGPDASPSRLEAPARARWIAARASSSGCLRA